MNYCLIVKYYFSMSVFVAFICCSYYYWEPCMISHAFVWNYGIFPRPLKCIEFICSYVLVCTVVSCIMWDYYVALTVTSHFFNVNAS